MLLDVISYMMSFGHIIDTYRLKLAAFVSDPFKFIAMKYMNGQLKPYAQGSLDDQATRSAVCNIMEGGQRALQKRCDRMLGVSLT